MPTSAKAYIVYGPTDDPVPGTIERRDPRADDVNIEILYCGICHSDLHVAHNDWGSTTYPFVPGHEIVGKVTSVGPDAKKYKPGDIVGVGCIVDSCEKCKFCELGKENWCGNRVGTYNVKGYDGEITKGGYSQSVVVRERYVLRVPTNLDLASSAPLLCAGITSYSPLKAHGAGPGKKVGVVGLGGLGAMAVKFAVAMGCDVTLFSRSHAKDANAKELGAQHVVASSVKEEMDSVDGSLDIIIDTVPFEHDLDQYLRTLTIDGRLIIVGQVGGQGLQTRNLMTGNRILSASNIGSIPETQDMLDFCGEHNITCDIELINYDYVGPAYKRVHSGDVKYRFVLDASTL